MRMELLIKLGPLSGQAKHCICRGWCRCSTCMHGGQLGLVLTFS
jgi:hypothetical protein